MIDIVVDFETFWDKTYRLDRMTTYEYVLDPRFEIIGVSVRTPDGVYHWVHGDANHVRSELLRLVPDWSAVRVVAHNARFEGAVLEWRLGIKPGAYLCTMVGSRPHFLPYARSVGLGALATHLALGTKGTVVHKTMGLHRDDFTGPMMKDYADYSIQDAALCYGISQRLVGILPPEEQEIINLTMLKFLRPRLRLSREALVARLKDIEDRKAALQTVLQNQFKADIGDIRSRTKFAQLLKDNGVEPPQKLNKKGNATYAFAKDDLEFKKLLMHPEPKIRALVSAKLALSSTLEESRTKRLIQLADLKDGWLPVPLVYYGAHPGRYAGDEEINLQNLPRVEYNKDKTLKKGHLRFCLVAPEGYSVVAADFSNIEARIVATLAEEWALVEGFRAGIDVYASFATDIYGRPIHKDTDPIERFVGKTCILGLGYGMGGNKFGLKLAQEGIPMTIKDAQRIVSVYRTKYKGIPKLWGKLESMAHLHMLKKDSICPSELAGATFAHERIILPNGMPLIYPGLRHGGRGLTFNSRFAGAPTTDENGHQTHSIWGGMFLENFSQALARIIAARAEVRLAKAGLPTALQVHDELVWVVPTAIVERVKSVVALAMTRPVDFMPRLPIAVEVKHGPTYGDAK